MASDSFLEPKNFSALDLFYGEKWLLESGVITESTADTLMSYGYMVPGVKKVDLKLDMDAANNFQSPTCSYELHFPFFKRFLYRKTKAAIAQGGLRGKLKLLLYIKLGAPSPRLVEGGLQRMALEFLPKSFQVSVNVR